MCCVALLGQNTLANCSDEFGGHHLNWKHAADVSCLGALAHIAVLCSLLQWGCGSCSNKVCIHETWINKASDVLFLSWQSLEDSVAVRSPMFFFSLQYHFVMQSGCVAARTAFNTEETASSLREWNCPPLSESPCPFPWHSVAVVLEGVWM